MTGPGERGRQPPNARAVSDPGSTRGADAPRSPVAGIPSPAAARVLAEAGVRPADVPGTGPGGRITKTDALRAQETGDKKQETAAKPANGPPSLAPVSRPLSPEPVFAVSACAAFYRRDAVLKAGGFPEHFRAYFEDVDLSLRLRRLGFRRDPHRMYAQATGATVTNNWFKRCRRWRQSRRGAPRRHRHNRGAPRKHKHRHKHRHNSRSGRSPRSGTHPAPRNPPARC